MRFTMAVTQLPSVTPLLLFVCPGDKLLFHVQPPNCDVQNDARTKIKLSTSTDTFHWWSLAIALKEPRHNCDGFSSLCNLDYIF